jgi:hypothetical protein
MTDERSSEKSPLENNIQELWCFMYEQRQLRVADLERWRQFVTAGSMTLLGGIIAGITIPENGVRFSDLLEDTSFLQATSVILFLAHFHAAWNQHRVVTLAASMRKIEEALQLDDNKRYYKIGIWRTVVYFPSTNATGCFLLALCVFRLSKNATVDWWALLFATAGVWLAFFIASIHAFDKFDPPRNEARGLTKMIRRFINK